MPSQLRLQSARMLKSCVRLGVFIVKLENFEEWFAIRANHQDDDHWPGRLTFDLAEGIHLTTARFAGDAESYGDPTFHASTMTGWLDYQRPTTLIHPWMQTVGGFTASMDTPAMRASYRFVVNAVLKNVFLEDINEPIFTGLVVDDPAMHAWINPNLVSHEWGGNDDPLRLRLSVGLAAPQHRSSTLSDGTEATVTSATRIPRDTTLTLDEHSVLRLRFPEPVNYDAITRITWRISTVFSFLIGSRVGSPVYQLPTTRARRWNDEDREVVAELWYRPALRGADAPPRTGSRFMVEGRSSLSLDKILELIVGKQDELIYLANIIQTVDDNDMPITQGYGELLGCLENFDANQFGSGAAPDFQAKMRSLECVVQKHRSKADQELFKRLRGGTRNAYSLLHRLERLHNYWHDGGFRGSPDLRRIRDLRNLLPHGRGLDVSNNVVQEMVTFSRYLAALGRYHILRALGCTGGEIAGAFSWQAHRYGMFVPQSSHEQRPYERPAST